MSNKQEFNAPSIEEAIERAAAALSVERDSLYYSILDEGSSGFLGLGARDARIMVELAEKVEEPLPVQSSQSAQNSIPASTEFSKGGQQEQRSTSTKDDEPESEVEAAHEQASEELLSEIQKRVETTLRTMAFDVEVSVQDTGEVITANIESEDAGLLIGQKGETIDALQYLINISVHRDQKSPKKIVLDCGGYRERRVKAVQGMAHRTAKRAIRESKAVDLPPMSSSERRAVHSYLKENPRVTSSSSGNGENRRVTIAPADTDR